MMAVVSVPVLSEHRTVMAAMSWRAGKFVIIACFSAIFAAPRAIVICMTIGSATGTEAIMRDRQSTISSQKLYPRTSTCLRRAGVRHDSEKGHRMSRVGTCN